MANISHTFIIVTIKLLLISLTLPSSASDCVFTLDDDLGTPQPLLLNGTSANNVSFHLPTNKYGDLVLRQNEIINLSCPGGLVKISGKNSQATNLEIKCSSGKSFQVIRTGQKALIKQFTCTKTISWAKYNGRRCLGNLSEITIGFPISAGSFLETVKVCFDKKNQSTAYSVFNLTAAIDGSQNRVPRPQFDDAGFYDLGNHELYNLYSVYVQRINVNRQLGLPSQSKKYIGSGDYTLTRGHLTARSDFVYGNQQNATFYYVNAAPQWGGFNEGNWNEVEKMVRDYAATTNTDLQVFTGTHGIATLPHEKSKKPTKIYLYSEKGKVGVPVPRAYWKVVYNSKTKAGIAFVGLNNPYEKQVAPDIYCKDICYQLKRWEFTWDKEDLTQGYSYCCEVNDLRRVVKNVPALVVNKILN